MSGMGLGCVITPTFNQRIEIPSRFRQFENQKCLRILLGEDDRENNSAHFWRVHVFTQPGSRGDMTCARQMSVSPPKADLDPPKRRTLDKPTSSLSIMVGLPNRGGNDARNSRHNNQRLKASSLE